MPTSKVTRTRFVLSKSEAGALMWELLVLLKVFETLSCIKQNTVQGMLTWRVETSEEKIRRALTFHFFCKQASQEINIHLSLLQPAGRSRRRPSKTHFKAY